MKIIRILICVLLFSTSFADAKVFLLVDKATREIKSLSDEDDAQMESGQEKIVLKVALEDIELLAHPRYYKYKNDRFVLNVKKMSDEETVATDREEKRAERNLIMRRLRRNAIAELEGEGVMFKYSHE